MKRILVFGLAALIISAPFIFSGCLKERNSAPYAMELEVWGVFDDSDVFSKINEQYAKNNPQIRRINYRKVSEKEADYERELLDALASGKGPDVFYFKNSWLVKHKNKIAPLSNSDRNIKLFEENFVDVARTDFIDNDGKVYAMPLYSDSLALYYNKNLLNQAGITTPATTWEELEDHVKLLTKIDKYGNIKQSGIALGRSGREPGGINRAVDIVTALMMQNGSTMNEENDRAAFNNYSSSYGDNSSPGTSGLEYYTQYTMGKSDLYTWNSKMDYSYDSFRFGKTAMMINYSYFIDRLKEDDPKLEFNVALLPQMNFDKKSTLASYMGLAVANNKEITDPEATYTNKDRVTESWKYISYLTMKPQKNLSLDPTVLYLTKSRKPAARRDLVEQQKTDADFGVFSQQALFSRSWIQPDNNAVDQIMNDMIEEVVTGKLPVHSAIQTAESRINAITKD